MNKIWLITAVCTVFFSFCSYGQAYRFQGTACDSASRKMIENVAVEATALKTVEKSSFTAITDVRGKFLLELPAGSYRFTLKVLGYSRRFSFLHSPFRWVK